MEPLHCRRCGRVMEMRKRWSDRGQVPSYCSKQCRSLRLRPIDRALEVAIVELLQERQPKTSICPSEAARRVRPDDWRGLMEPARMAARRLVVQGTVEIAQGGRTVDPSTAKGPIRIRRGARYAQ